MSSFEKPTRPEIKVGGYFIGIGLVWVAVVAASLFYNLNQVRSTALEAARIQARVAFEKDVIYRRWNSMHGGVFAPVSPKTPPNPYLEEKGREIEPENGNILTKINPAYMTRQVHELGALKSGVLGHITSLNPIRPQNAPDPWETEALKAFEKGEAEVSGIQTLNGEEYMRLMRPLITEEGCLKCHAAQGYKLGEIRGGISVSTPLQPLLAGAGKVQVLLTVTHALFLLLGLFFLGLAGRHLRLRIEERKKAEDERERILMELQSANKEVQKLQGFIPICSHCKKIRDDEGYWQQVEIYVQANSEAEFSHSICPECLEDNFPDIARRLREKKGMGESA